MDYLNSFKELGLSDRSLKALHKKGFEEPTPIQKMVIPHFLKGETDIVGQAQTGTGKTAAFGLPIIELLEKRKNKIQALVLTPTRELAIQVSEELNSLKGDRTIQIVPIYGGQSYDVQFKRLNKGAEIVVGTPGRLIDNIHKKKVDLSEIKFLVIDEADEMLNMGFIDDMEEIIKTTPKEKRVLLFSATMPQSILNIAKKYMGKYEHFAENKENMTVELTEQIYFEVAQQDKFEALCRIMDIESDFYGLVFCRTKVDVDNLGGRLVDRGYDAESLHGDLSQFQREKIMDKFKKKRVSILVATDVAARGIDVIDLTHVINYSLPQDPESYVHRIGRTGRAGKEGTAITFVTPEEYRKLLFIKKVAGTDIKREKIPGIKDVIESKKKRIIDQILEIVDKEDYTGYLELSKELLEDRVPEEVFAALLKYSFQEELDESNYNQIKDISIDKKGKARLFVALGRNDGMNPKKLVQLIQTKSGVTDNKIRDIEIFEKFSFLNVPFEEAEIILNSFKSKGKGKKSLISKAREKS